MPDTHKVARVGSVLLAFCLAMNSASGELFLTAHVMDTPGLDGFQTYTITASSALGHIAGFDFGSTGFGITGSLFQQDMPAGIDTIFADSPEINYEHITFAQSMTDAAFDLDRAFDQPPPDTRYLVSTQDGLAINPTESSSHLEAVFSFIGSDRQQMHQHLPFAKIVTDDPDSVQLSGAFISRLPGPKAYSTSSVDVGLSEIEISTVPELELPSVMVASQESGHTVRPGDPRLDRTDPNYEKVRRALAEQQNGKFGLEPISAKEPNASVDPPLAAPAPQPTPTVPVVAETPFSAPTYEPVEVSLPPVELPELPEPATEPVPEPASLTPSVLPIVTERFPLGLEVVNLIELTEAERIGWQPVTVEYELLSRTPNIPNYALEDSGIAYDLIDFAPIATGQFVNFPSFAMVESESTVPEPVTWLLFAGLSGILSLARWRQGYTNSSTFEGMF